MKKGVFEGYPYLYEVQDYGDKKKIIVRDVNKVKRIFAWVLDGELSVQINRLVKALKRELEVDFLFRNPDKFRKKCGRKPKNEVTRVNEERF